MTTWLLDIDLHGRTLRLGLDAVEIDTAAGDVLVYDAGIVSDVSVAAGDEDVDLEIVLPGTLVPAEVILDLDGARATLLRWTEGTVSEAAEVVIVGRVVEPACGGDAEPITLTISADVAPDERLMPDIQAVVDETTWPVTPSSTVPDSQIGIRYPEIFGYPGHTGASTPRPCVPVPLAEYRESAGVPLYTDCHVVLAARPIDATRAYVADLGRVDRPEGWLAAAAGVDLLGRPILVADLDAIDGHGLTPDPDNFTSSEFYAGFHPTYGGGRVRSAYDVIAWVLRTWGDPGRVDWSRLPEVEALLSAYQVDAFVNDMIRPWEWIESVLLPNLPVEIHEGRRGRYLERVRWWATARDAIGSLSVDRGEADRTSGVSVVGGADVANEISISYGPIPGGGWARTHTIAAEAGRLASAAVGVSSDARVVGHPLAARSRAKYGIRVADPIELTWCWDAGTAVRVGQDAIEQYALPARRVTVRVRSDDGSDLRAGDVVLLSDSEIALSDAPAIVTGPPLLGPEGASVTFRVPQ